MSIQAYQNAAKKTEGPRQTEYRAFAMATRSLIDAASLPVTEVGRRAEALAVNRRLWSLLAADCAAEGNQLSQPLRARSFPCPCSSTGTPARSCAMARRWTS